MDSPSHSNSSLVPFTKEFPHEKCQICDQKAHGNHFGAITCRACAAFFRRVGASNSVKPCKKSNRCSYLKAGWFNCKKCRLDKCWKMGMTVDKFQYFREASTVLNTFKIPNTINTLLGESSLIIISNKMCKNNGKPKNYINLDLLLEKARNVLEMGLESPLIFQNSCVLNKLAIALNDSRGNMTSSPEPILRLGKEEIMAVWQKDVLKVAKWLTYFESLQQLPKDMQLELLKSMWHVWCRLEHVARTAMARRRKLCEYNQVIMNFDDRSYSADLNTLDVDLSWCSDYKMEQLRFFFPNDHTRLESLIDMFLEAEPSDEELSYLLCQICFESVRKRHDGEMLKVVDKFQKLIEDDLHNYYVKERKMPRYCGRLAKLLKINNKLIEIFNHERVRKELAGVFKVFNVEVSHPEMFRDDWGIVGSSTD